MAWDGEDSYRPRTTFSRFANRDRLFTVKFVIDEGSDKTALSNNNFRHFLKFLQILLDLCKWYVPFFYVINLSSDTRVWDISSSTFWLSLVANLFFSLIYLLIFKYCCLFVIAFYKWNVRISLIPQNISDFILEWKTTRVLTVLNTPIHSENISVVRTLFLSSQDLSISSCLKMVFQLY